MWVWLRYGAIRYYHSLWLEGKSMDMHSLSTVLFTVLAEEQFLPVRHTLFVSFCYQLCCCYYVIAVSFKLFLSQLGMSAICLSLEGMGTGKQLVVFHFSGSTKLRNTKPRQSHFYLVKMRHSTVHFLIQ